jgi:hypothetical protein
MSLRSIILYRYHRNLHRVVVRTLVLLWLYDEGHKVACPTLEILWLKVLDRGIKVLVGRKEIRNITTDVTELRRYNMIANRDTAYDRGIMIV